jgi:hypothetical protein
MRYRHRIVRLEEYRRTRLPPSHFLAIVCTPWDLDPVDEDEWLQTLVCACGRVGCPELRIGAGHSCQRRHRVHRHGANVCESTARSGEAAMRNAQHRLAQLETQFQGRWPVEVESAKARALARVRLKIATALDAVGDARFKADVALLADDTPEQAAADLETLRRWAQRHPQTLYSDSTARDRITAKLEEMAQRMLARKGDDEPEDAA